MGPESFDVVVVGAGVHGLVAAKTYVETSPTARVVVLERASTVGGVWAKSRIYSGLHSNNMWGTYEYSDFPMDTATFGVKKGEYIPGGVLFKYFDAYADKFDLKKIIRCGCSVESAELKGDGSWEVVYVKEGAKVVIGTQKLIVATGLTSEPRMPIFEGAESFGKPMFHAIELLPREEEMKSAKTVVVVGGSKSAADTVYQYASRGVKVEWVIRKTGNGPQWLSGSYVTPLSLWLEDLLFVRALTFMGPTLHSDGYSLARWFFHDTWLGRRMASAFYWVLTAETTANSKYKAHPETQKLLPKPPIFFVGASVAILNYPTDFFGIIRSGLVNVHEGEIASLSPGTVHLTTGTSIPTDGLICSTGWKHLPPLKFLPATLSVGLKPHHPSDPLVQRADAEVLSRFPQLAHAPALNSTPDADKGLLSYELTRHMIPPEFVAQRNLAFAGMMLSYKTAIEAQTQALWIAAFFTRRLDLGAALAGDEGVAAEEDSLAERAKWEAVLQNRFWRWRVPNGHGAMFPEPVFEMLPYLDTLLRDLGLNPRRKGGWREIFTPYMAADYIGLVEEWLAKEEADADAKAASSERAH